MKTKVVQIAAWLLITALMIYLLIIAKHLIIPLVVAVSFWYLIITIADYLERIRIFGRSIPRFLSLLAGAVVIIAVFAFSIDIILRNVEKMVIAVPRYEETLNALIAEVVSWLHLEETPSLNRLLRQIDLRPLLVSLGTGISNIAGKLVLIIIYIVFLLLEQSSFQLKFRAFFSNPKNYQQGLRILDRINQSIKTYITVKFLASFLTGGLSYITLRIIGVQFAEFWAFLIFLMNFIPSIGSIIATGLVALFALLQFQDFTNFFITLISVGAIQLLIGNYMDPRMMGRTLNISPLVVLFSLALWGSIWGVIGMILSVPITVTIMIILAQFPVTAPIAVALSQNGRILDLEEQITKNQKKRRRKSEEAKQEVG